MRPIDLMNQGSRIRSVGLRILFLKDTCIR